MRMTPCGVVRLSMGTNWLFRQMRSNFWTSMALTDLRRLPALFAGLVQFGLVLVRQPEVHPVSAMRAFGVVDHVPGLEHAVAARIAVDLENDAELIAPAPLARDQGFHAGRNVGEDGLVVAHGSHLSMSGRPSMRGKTCLHWMQTRLST